MLARKAGMSWQDVDLIIKGKRQPKRETAERLSEATGGEVSVAEILCAKVHEETVAPTPAAAEGQ
jgi:hypothetical protein